MTKRVQKSICQVKSNKDLFFENSLIDALPWRLLTVLAYVRARFYKGRMSLTYREISISQGCSIQTTRRATKSLVVLGLLGKDGDCYWGTGLDYYNPLPMPRSDFTKIPIRLVKCRLRPEVRAILFILLRHSFGSKNVWPSIHRISTTLHMRKRKVSRILRQLDNRGLLKIESRKSERGRYHVYRLPNSAELVRRIELLIAQGDCADLILEPIPNGNHTLSTSELNPLHPGTDTPISREPEEVVLKEEEDDFEEGRVGEAAATQNKTIPSPLKGDGGWEESAEGTEEEAEEPRNGWQRPSVSMKSISEAKEFEEAYDAERKRKYGPEFALPWLHKPERVIINELMAAYGIDRLRKMLRLLFDNFEMISENVGGRFGFPNIYTLNLLAPMLDRHVTQGKTTVERALTREEQSKIRRKEKSWIHEGYRSASVIGWGEGDKFKKKRKKFVDDEDLPF